MPYALESLMHCLTARSIPKLDLIALTNHANQHLVTPQLHVAMEAQSGWRDDDLPVLAYWQRAWQANVRRNAGLRDQLTRLVERLSGAGVRPILFTGATVLAHAKDSFQAARMVPDLDILLCENEIDAAIEAIQQDGYVPAEGGPSAHTVGKFIPSEGMALLHLHRCAPGSGGALAAREIANGGTVVSLGGGEAVVPSPTDALCIVIAHDLLQDRGLVRGTVHVRHLLDVHRDHLEDRIDWERVQRRFPSRIQRMATQMFRMNLERLFGPGPAGPFRPPWWCGAQYRRQLLRFESRAYAMVDHVLLVETARWLWQVPKAARGITIPIDLQKMPRP